MERTCRGLFVIAILFGNSVLATSQDYNILNFGAIPDGVTLNSPSIQAAIDAAHANQGGRVIIPSGRFLSGSVVLKSGVELHLQKNAVLLGSTDPADYINLKRYKAIVMADHEKDISITGSGEIDGQGRELALHIDSLFFAGQIDSLQYNFVEGRPKYYLRPQLVEFVNCESIIVKGVTLRNAASWVQTYDFCRNLILDSVKVISDAYWNNDGIDISDCTNVVITNCDINSADDGICLKSHSATDRCDSVYISNCIVRSSASAVKFGTRSHGGFRNIEIRDIRVYDTFRSAIAIECVDGGVLEDVIVDGIEATNTGNAIFIRLGKRNKTGPVGALRNITIRNMKVDVAFERPDYAYDMRGPELPFFHNVFPSSITGIPGYSVENVSLENIQIAYPGRGNKGLAYAPLSRLDAVPEKIEDYPEFSMFGELPAWGFYIRHVDGLSLKNITLKVEQPDYRPSLVFDDVRGLEADGIEILGDSKETRVVMKDTESGTIERLEGVLKF